MTSDVYPDMDRHFRSGLKDLILSESSWPFMSGSSTSVCSRSAGSSQKWMSKEVRPRVSARVHPRISSEATFVDLYAGNADAVRGHHEDPCEFLFGLLALDDVQQGGKALPGLRDECYRKKDIPPENNK